MLIRKFGSTGWDVSVMGLGTWNIGNQWGEMDDATAEAIVRAAYDGGMNLFDAAESYGEPQGLSEMRLGRALKGIRDNVYIVSKVGHWGARTGQGIPKTTKDLIRGCGHACAGRLRTDYIDVLLCHDGGIEDPSIYIAGFEDLKDEGFIRAYGISPGGLDALKRFHEMSGGKCAVAELDYSLLNRDPEQDLLPYCQENGIGVLVRGPVAMGLLSGTRSSTTSFSDPVRAGWNAGGPNRPEFEEKITRVEEIKAAIGGADLVTTALRYVISHPVNAVAIPGATSTKQAAHNAAAGERALTAEELAALPA
ncbi:MAG: aldo/keto reductase [Planctomycetaceae bacterium]|nr:aldo/keto reductase [Planctomycetaceae bacterium]